jgi:hypothetical protein
MTEINLDTTAGATGSEIRNSGTLVRAYCFGEASDVTVHGVPFKGAANASGDSSLSGSWGGSAVLDYYPAPSDANYKSLHAAAALELDALLPSVLDRAFKREF